MGKVPVYSVDEAGIALEAGEPVARVRSGSMRFAFKARPELLLQFVVDAIGVVDELRARGSAEVVSILPGAEIMRGEKL